MVLFGNGRHFRRVLCIFSAVFSLGVLSSQAAAKDAVSVNHNSIGSPYEGRDIGRFAEPGCGR